MKRLSSWLAVLCTLTFIASLFQPWSAAQAEASFQTSEVQTLLAAMTPEERVGQLFLVTFQGTDTHDQTRIYDLIANHHVGGVILLAANDNFLPGPDPDTVTSAHQLISALQTVEADAATRAEADVQSDARAYVPLLIGISQEGDGTPYDQILSGLTPLPNPMAIGATWRTDLAQQVGSVMGSELSAVGFNLYLGPSLDVVEAPNPSARIDLGPRIFGGDPFWVGEMGRAYISGLHAGSDGRMVVVAKHFPGRGASDRSPEEEVATVRKSLDQLEQVELLPFFAVTSSAEAGQLADGLLVSHIRYQGFQGNIRATTRPVSLDEAALSEVIALPQFATWRDNGGIIVSDALGSPAVRGFYSQSGENFSPRLVARDAFLAGNDLLYLGNITSETEDTYTATLGILDFFAQQYTSDRAFAQLVDEAVARILAQKLRMYGEFSLDNTLVPEGGLATLNSSEDVVFEVARDAATLVNPGPEELSTLLPSPPNQADRIAFLTDTAPYKQCTTCLWQEGLPADALQKTILRLYGSTGSGQVFESRLNSFPLQELEAMLKGESTTDIEGILTRADWIVISLTDVRNGQIGLLQRFFAERPNLTRNRNVILFSFTTPYYLDATDVSKLTAYYALYSKQPAFVEVAARLLFQQMAAQGASPVSIVAVEYDLIEETSPDPAQVIPLAEDKVMEATPTGETPTAEAAAITSTPTEIPPYRIGDTIAVRAGPILDHNGHLVPDGTPVTFIMTTRDETGEIPLQTVSTTLDGMARASFALDRPGAVEIRVVSEPAMVSDVVQMKATGDEGFVPVIITPTSPITNTPEPMIPTVTPAPESDLITREGYPRIGSWLLVMLAEIGGAVLVFWAVSTTVSRRWALRWALCVFLGGMLAYNYLAFGFPGAKEWIASSAGAFGVLILTFAGEATGALGAWVWMRILSGSRSRED